MKMHADEVMTDVTLVQNLLTGQFPHWADLPIQPVPSAGTDNALYRFGPDLVVRLPRIYWAIDQIAKERCWLPKLRPQLPLEIPKQIAIGQPDAGYPWEWQSTNGSMVRMFPWIKLLILVRPRWRSPNFSKPYSKLILLMDPQL